MTFYPGIWRITGTSGSNFDYALVQLNTVMYNSRGDANNIFPCQIFNISDADQFTASSRSAVGLYSYTTGAQLLRIY